MTESEELKNDTEKARVKQKIDEVSAYLDLLTARIDEYRRRDYASDIIYLLAWITWTVGTVLMPEAGKALMIGWVFSLIYSFFWRTKLHGAYKEFVGAITVLEILGMIPPLGGDSERKSRRTWSEGIEMVKRWTARKQKMQQEVYAGT